MITTINTMRKTSAEWGRQNPVLPDDMLGIEELESGKYKIKRGDGETAWDSLDYFTGAELSRDECAGIVSDYTTGQKSKIPAPNKAAVYDGHRGLKSDKPLGTRTLTDEAADSTLVPVAAKKLLPWLQGIRNNLKWALNNLLTKSAANTWVDVPFTAAANVTVLNFYAKYNEALNIMRLHFNYETITTFTIGMLVLTLALPVTLSSARRGIIILDAPSATRRVACDVDVNPGGNITLYPCMEQFTGTVPALDGSKLHGDIWVYMG
jgi:hypothetical protein